MFRKNFMALILLLTLPAFANAWTVNAKTSPLSGLGAISPRGNINYAAGQNSAAFTVAPAAGKVVTRVTIDGVSVPLAASYVVPYSGKSY